MKKRTKSSIKQREAGMGKVGDFQDESLEWAPATNIDPKKGSALKQAPKKPSQAPFKG